MAPNLKKLKGLGGHKSNPEYTAANMEEGADLESGSFLTESQRNNDVGPEPTIKQNPQDENPYMDEYKS